MIATPVGSRESQTWVQTLPLTSWMPLVKLFISEGQHPCPGFFVLFFVFFFFFGIVDLQCCINFCFLRPSRTYVNFLFLVPFPIMFYPKRLDIVPCAVQEDPIVLSTPNVIFCIYQPPTPHPSHFLSPSPLATTSLLFMSLIYFSFVDRIICAIF